MASTFSCDHWKHEKKNHCFISVSHRLWKQKSKTTSCWIFTSSSWNVSVYKKQLHVDARSTTPASRCHTLNINHNNGLRITDSSAHCECSSHQFAFVVMAAANKITESARFCFYLPGCTATCIRCKNKCTNHRSVLNLHIALMLCCWAAAGATACRLLSFTWNFYWSFKIFQYFNWGL